MHEPKTYRSKPSEIEAMRWTGENTPALAEWLGEAFDGLNEDLTGKEQSVLRFLCAANDALLGIVPGDWIARDSTGFYPIKPEIFANRWTDDDTTSVSFSMKMVDGDEATVTVDGFKQAATAARALVHCGSPDVVLKLLQRYAEQGDMSAVSLATEMGALAEKKAGVHKS